MPPENALEAVAEHLQDAHGRGLGGLVLPGVPDAPEVVHVEVDPGTVPVDVQVPALDQALDDVLPDVEIQGGFTEREEEWISWVRHDPSDR
jgi:hypothetical protein